MPGCFAMTVIELEALDEGAIEKSVGERVEFL